MGGLCGWVVFGFLAGLIARALMPGKQNLGWIATTLLGVAGSFVGGFAAGLITGHPWRGLHPSGFIGAVAGAVILLIIGEAMNKKKKHR